jgi:hypothetical protein
MRTGRYAVAGARKKGKARRNATLSGVCQKKPLNKITQNSRKTHLKNQIEVLLKFIKSLLENLV